MFSIFSLAFALWLLIDPIGNIPYYIALLTGIPRKRQIIIIIRENLIALGVMILFCFIGDMLLDFLHISTVSIQISGGVILFLLAMRMVFSPIKVSSHNPDLIKITEPLVVPLAIPLVAGPAVLSAIMIYTSQESYLTMTGAILLAWFFSALILLGAPKMEKFLGPRGVLACERLMGLVLIFIATQMFLTGIGSFVKTL